MANNDGCLHSSSEFESGAVTVRGAGKCSASVSYRSDSASVRAAQKQPELILFHLDHSSLPWMRMLRLTGGSLSSSVSCSQALFLLLECRSSAHSLCLADASACFSALFLYCALSLLCFFSAPFGCSVSSFSFHGDFLSLSILFILSSQKKRKWRLRMGQTQWRSWTTFQVRPFQRYSSACASALNAEWRGDQGGPLFL